MVSRRASWLVGIVEYGMRGGLTPSRERKGILATKGGAGRVSILYRHRANTVSMTMWFQEWTRSFHLTKSQHLKRRTRNLKNLAFWWGRVVKDWWRNMETYIDSKLLRVWRPALLPNQKSNAEQHKETVDNWSNIKLNDNIKGSGKCYTTKYKVRAGRRRRNWHGRGRG